MWACPRENEQRDSERGGGEEEIGMGRQKCSSSFPFFPAQPHPAKIEEILFSHFPPNFFQMSRLKQPGEIISSPPPPPLDSS